MDLLGFKVKYIRFLEYQTQQVHKSALQFLSIFIGKNSILYTFLADSLFYVAQVREKVHLGGPYAQSYTRHALAWEKKMHIYRCSSAASVAPFLGNCSLHVHVLPIALLQTAASAALSSSAPAAASATTSKSTSSLPSSTAAASASASTGVHNHHEKKN